MGRHGIPTKYRGTMFRSRLEARWAAFFDLLGWEWVYEPIDGHGYVPDFALMGACPVLVEVKPDLAVDDLERYVAKVRAGLFGLWEHDVLIVGATPLPRSSDPHYGASQPAIGLLGEWFDVEHGQVFAEGLWHTCGACARPSFHHCEHSFRSRVCGHYDGDHYLGAAPDLERLWATATNAVQWHPASA
jgi:hypothetical protein